MSGYFQIGWSDEYRRDIRLEVSGTMSAPVFRIARYLPNGEVTYIKLLLGEAVRLYSALYQVIRTQQETTKIYQEPDKSAWTAEQTTDDPEEDDSLSSD